MGCQCIKKASTYVPFMKQVQNLRSGVSYCVSP